MDAAGTRREVDRILEARLAELTRQVGLSHPASQVVAWCLPEQDRFALTDHGLPPARTDGLLGMVGGLQESEEPEPGPDGRRIYRVGTYGTSRLAAVEGAGEVVAIPADSQVHPDLAHLHPAGILPTAVSGFWADVIVDVW